MKKSIVKILDIIENDISNIQNELTYDEWAEFQNQMFSLFDIIESNIQENKIEVVTDEMLSLISQNNYIENLIVEEMNSENLRAAIPPIEQQSEKITEHLLYQRINNVRSSIDGLNKKEKGKVNNEKVKRPRDL